MADKNTLLHEIEIVTTFSEKYDMSDPSQVGRYIDFFEKKSVFQTPVGIQYLDRLKKIQNGSTSDSTSEPCFICKRNASYDGVLCTSCMNRYSKGTKKFYAQHTASDSTPAHNPEQRRTAAVSGAAQLQEATEKVKKKASLFGRKVQDRLKEDDVQKAKAELTAKATQAGKKAKQFAKDKKLDEKADAAKGQAFRLWARIRARWNQLSKKQRLIGAAIGAVILIVLIGGGAGAAGGSAKKGEMVTANGVEFDIFTKNDPSITSLKDAEKLVRKYYSEKDDWRINSATESKSFTGYFWTPIGRSASYIEKNSSALSSVNQEYYRQFYQTEPVYSFTIQQMNQTGQYGQVWVNQSGRILIQGHFSSTPVDDERYRLR